MAYIHTLKEWPLFRWDTELVAPALSRLRYAQGLFAGRCLAMDERARAQAAGLVLAHEAAQDLRAVLADVDENPEKLLTAARIPAWHKAAGGAGTWRVSGAEGTPEPARIPEEIKTLLAWFNFGSLPARDGAEPRSLWRDPVIRAGIAYLWFTGIRPVSRGSDRLALAVCNLALVRADAGKPWYSLGQILTREREKCREALGSALRGDMDVTPWLAWFIGALERAVDDAESLIAPAIKRGRAFDRMRSAPLNRRQKAMLSALLEDGEKFISSGVYAEAAGCSNDTALRDIQELMDLGFLRKNRAGGRSTSYSLKA